MDSFNYKGCKIPFILIIAIILETHEEVGFNIGKSDLEDFLPMGRHFWNKAIKELVKFNKKNNYTYLLSRSEYRGIHLNERTLPKSIQRLLEDFDFNLYCRDYLLKVKKGDAW